MKHFKHAFLYLFCIVAIPYVLIRTLTSLLIILDGWNDKIINQFEIDAIQFVTIPTEEEEAEK